MSHADFLSSIASPDLKNVAMHWNDARGERRMPGWQDIKPSRIAAQLPMIWVYRHDGASDTFTGRLAGDMIEQVFGKSFRGAPMRDLYPSGDYQRLFDRAKRVISEPAFYRGEGVVFIHVDRYGPGERIMLPLADGGGAADGILGATVYRTLTGVVPLPEPEKENWFAL